MAHELSKALRNEIRAALEAGGRPFDVNVARRVYDLAIAARDMCAAATDIENEDGVRRYLTKRDQERKPMSPELSEALRNEIRTALEAGGGPFDIHVARRVYDLAIAARDMCVAASSTVKEAIDQIKDTGGPMETLDAADTPESGIQASESFGARLLRELMATLPMLQGSRGEDPKRLVHALAEARRNGMHDVAEQLEVKLFGRALSGSWPVIAEEIEVDEGSYEHGFADGRVGALPVSQAGAYHEGYLKGTEAKYLDPSGDVPALCEACQKYPRPIGTPCHACREIMRSQPSTRTGDHSAAIALDVQRGRTSQEIRDEIIAKVGMMAYLRTPEMQARYDAAVERERSNGAANVPCEVLCHVCGRYEKLVKGDRVTWGISRSGVIQDLEGLDLIILDDGWEGTPLGQEPRQVATPPFEFRRRCAELTRLRKVNCASDNVNAPCDHPTEALYDSPYDDGYQVFCDVCGKHVRLGRVFRTRADVIAKPPMSRFIEPAPGYEYQRAQKIADVRAYAPTPDAPCSLCGHPAGSMHKAGCGSNTDDDELDRLALIARGWKAPSETWVCGHGKRHPNPAPGFSMCCNCSITVNGATP